MSETVLQITDEALVKWVKQYAAAREESLGAIVTEALGEYRERILALVRPDPNKTEWKDPLPMMSVEYPNAVTMQADWTKLEPKPATEADVTVEPALKGSIPPMVPSPEELF